MEIGPEPESQGLVPFIAKATSFLIRLLGFSSSFKEQLQVTLAVVGCGVGRIQVDGLIISCQRFLIALQLIKDNALVVVSCCIVRVQVDHLLISGQCLLKAFKILENIALIEVIMSVASDANAT